MSTANNDKTLRPNPYQTYRDPSSGKWIVVTANEGSNCNQTQQAA
ncbi:hypothetical protein [Phormidium sp. CCY1219]|nr:hypothetical protein [Phormidium sp. CCY1219]